MTKSTNHPVKARQTLRRKSALSDASDQKTPRLSTPVELPAGLSYAKIARETGRTTSHVRRVCRGDRESQSLLAYIEKRLAKYEAGIGYN